MNNIKRIAVLVSGNGTNLQALIDTQETEGLGGGKIALVISSNWDAYALNRAEDNKIKTAVVEWDKYKGKKHGRRMFGERILHLLSGNSIDLVVYAGFMIILDESVVKAYPNAMINVHPSLIPAFSGEGYYGIKVHQAAIARGVKLSGATVHFVNEVCDGGPIIMQKAIELRENETPETLQRRVMEIERAILPQAVKMFCKGELQGI